MTTHLTIQNVACPKCKASPINLAVSKRFAAIPRAVSTEVQEDSELGTCEQCKAKVAMLDTRVMQKTGEENVTVKIYVWLSPTAYLSDTRCTRDDELLTAIVDIVGPPLEPCPTCGHRPAL